jgi:hypothetical protein
MERKANAPSWLHCGGGQPTFVTAWARSDVDSWKGRLLRLSNISYSFNRVVLPLIGGSKGIQPLKACKNCGPEVERYHPAL